MEEKKNDEKIIDRAAIGFRTERPLRYLPWKTRPSRSYGGKHAAVEVIKVVAASSARCIQWTRLFNYHRHTIISIRERTDGRTRLTKRCSTKLNGNESICAAIRGPCTLDAKIAAVYKPTTAVYVREERREHNY